MGECPNNDGKSSQPHDAWHPLGVAFAWQPHSVMQAIEQTLERDEAASAKLTYSALTRVASQKRSRTFTVPLNYIAVLASLSGDTITRRLTDLERLGLVKITRHAGVRVPHTYTLVHPADTAPCSNVAAQIPGVRAVLNQKRKSLKNTLKSTRKTHITAGADDVFSSLTPDERKVVDLYHRCC